MTPYITESCPMAPLYRPTGVSFHNLDKSLAARMAVCLTNPTNYVDDFLIQTQPSLRLNRAYWARDRGRDWYRSEDGACVGGYWRKGVRKVKED